MYNITPSKQFKKDYKALIKQKKDISKLDEVIDSLAQGKELPERFRDHELSGNLKGMRECHVSPNWLLLYEKDKNLLRLYLIKSGNHKHVLGKE